MEEIVNKVAKSGLITIDMGELYTPGERVLIDIKDQLWKGMVLREKDFREYIRENDWSEYQNKFVAVSCSADAIIQKWAIMLLASALQPYAAKVVFGSIEQLETQLFEDTIAKLNVEEYHDARIVIKGCGDKYIPESAYITLTSKLQPVVKTLMFGEPCSTVPVYKRAK